MPAYFLINEKKVPFNSAAHDEEMPLLWFLRDIVKLTDTKYGCGIGLCGACTVLINGKAKRSCQIPLAQLNETDAITTIQGLNVNAPTILRWKKNNIPQCGYCQTGIILSCHSAYLSSSSATTELSLTKQHLCRCGTYQRMERQTDI